MFCTQGAQNFMRDILKQEPDNLALKFEAWVINKVDDARKSAHLLTCW